MYTHRRFGTAAAKASLHYTGVCESCGRRWSERSGSRFVGKNIEHVTLTMQWNGFAWRKAETARRIFSAGHELGSFVWRRRKRVFGKLQTT